MLAKIFRILVFVLLPSFLAAQSLSLSATDQTANHDPSTFLLEAGSVSISSGFIEFLNSGKTVSGFKTLGISSDHSKVALLKWGGEKGEALMLDSSGEMLNSYSTISLADETSFGVYPFNNGDLLLRDKISNFTFYDTVGEISKSVSSSSQSEEGQKISEVAMSAGGETLVIYNPQVKRSGELGSSAMVKRGDEFNDIFFSQDRFLKNVTVSEDGNIIVLITAKSGTDDRAIIMDKFGNELNTITSDEDLVGASLTEDFEYITLYSGGRVMVFSLLDGESLGATSFRSSIFLADYFPEDNMILALTGSYSEHSGVMNNAEFRAIDLKERAIESNEFPGALGFQKAMNPRFERTSSNQYKLLGGSKVIEIEANF